MNIFCKQNFEGVVKSEIITKTPLKVELVSESEKIESKMLDLKKISKKITYIVSIIVPLSFLFWIIYQYWILLKNWQLAFFSWTQVLVDATIFAFPILVAILSFYLGIFFNKNLKWYKWWHMIFIIFIIFYFILYIKNNLLFLEEITLYEIIIKLTIIITLLSTLIIRLLNKNIWNHSFLALWTFMLISIMFIETTFIYFETYLKTFTIIFLWILFIKIFVFTSFTLGFVLYNFFKELNYDDLKKNFFFIKKDFFKFLDFVLYISWYWSVLYILIFATIISFSSWINAIEDSKYKDLKFVVKDYNELKDFLETPYSDSSIKENLLLSGSDIIYINDKYIFWKGFVYPNDRGVIFYKK